MNKPYTVENLAAAIERRDRLRRATGEFACYCSLDDRPTLRWRAG